MLKVIHSNPPLFFVNFFLMTGRGRRITAYFHFSIFFDAATVEQIRGKPELRCVLQLKNIRFRILCVHGCANETINARTMTVSRAYRTVDGILIYYRTFPAIVYLRFSLSHPFVGVFFFFFSSFLHFLSFSLEFFNTIFFYYSLPKVMRCNVYSQRVKRSKAFRKVYCR